MDSKNYRSLGDAYKQMFMEAPEGGKPDRPGGAYPVPVPFRPLRPVQVHRTNVEIDVTQPYVGPGEVEKAYYTYPQGFDPTNREDITRKGTTNEDVEVTDEEFYNFMVEEGIVSDVDSAEKMIDHMADDWFMSLYEESKKKKGRCWTGYKPTPGKEPYSPGSCKKA